MDKNWKSIETGKEYPITVKFGDEAPWTLNMMGRRGSDIPTLVFEVDAHAKNSGDFVEEFMRELRMTLDFEGKPLGTFSLRGSRLAFKEVVACQRSFNDAMSSVEDPFAASGQASQPDPFR